MQVARLCLPLGKGRAGVTAGAPRSAEPERVSRRTRGVRIWTLVEAVVEPHHLPASAALLVVTCLMHSERLELHEQAHTHHCAYTFTDSY